MKGFIFFLLVSVPVSLFAANDAPFIYEARVAYNQQSAPELSIYGQNLCSSKRQDGLAIVLGGTVLAEVNCQMIGSLDDPMDLVTAPLLHDPLPGDYWLEAIVYSGNTGIAVRFFMTLGAAGPQGIQGIEGIQGIQGLKGDQGIQGIQGLKGDQGIQGIQGLIGEQGIQGNQGLKGDQGIQGIQGLIGEQGLQGIQGLTGDQGSSGLKGDQGAQGLRGNVGDMGPAGVMGMQGDKGDAGESGIAFLVSRSCAEGEYLAGFQVDGELLCRTLALEVTPEPTPPGDEPDPDFSTACFSFDNDENVNLQGNDWFDSCVKPNATSLRILVKDASGTTVYDESAAVGDAWSNDNITSTAGMTSQHVTIAHDQILTMTNNDKMIITGKNSQSTLGCFSSYANGYGLVVYSPDGSSNSEMKLLVMGYEHGISGGPRSLSGWTESNELTYSPGGLINSCDGATMSGSSLTGSVAIFVE